MLDSDLVAHFWVFVAERHRVWWRRHAALRPWPWTDDPVLRGAHLTNVYRELDPGTQVVLPRLVAAPTPRDAVALVVAYRFVNKRSVLETFGSHGPYAVDRHAWLAHLEALHARGESVRTRRHLTPSGRYHALALEAVADPSFSWPATSAACWAALQALPGVGPFTGWQLYADLAQSGHVESLDPRFVRVGDGAAFALAVLERQRTTSQYHHDGSTSRAGGGRVRPGRREQSRLAGLVLELLDGQLHHLPTGFLTVYPHRPLAVWDLEHALCEWLRYELLKSGARQLGPQNEYRGAS